MSDDYTPELDARLQSEGAPGEAHRAIPRWLLLVYALLAVWGAIWLGFYFNGNQGGFLDRGHWGQLQKTARTTWDSGHYGIREVSAEEALAE